MRRTGWIIVLWLIGITTAGCANDANSTFSTADGNRVIDNSPTASMAASDRHLLQSIRTVNYRQHRRQKPP